MLYVQIEQKRHGLLKTVLPLVKIKKDQLLFALRFCSIPGYRVVFCLAGCYFGLEILDFTFCSASYYKLKKGCSSIGVLPASAREC